MPTKSSSIEITEGDTEHNIEECSSTVGTLTGAGASNSERLTSPSCDGDKYQAHSLATHTEQPFVRHQGHVHVRGRIRRVWRPRILQLWKDGLVRYHECEANDGRKEGPFTAAGLTMKSLKYTLEMKEPRLLKQSDEDTTWTTSDSLPPQNMVGFCVLGRRVTNTDKGIIAVGTWRTVSCAVPSMQEAQMWIVALQWAAQMRRDVEQEAQSRLQDPGTLADVPEDDLNDDWTAISVMDDQEYPRLKKELAETPPSATSHQQEERLEEKNANQNRRQKKKSNASSKIVVTKTTHYRVVRVGLLRFEIAYEIHCLLLHQGNAEHWSILRTADDLERLMNAMENELGHVDLKVSQHLAPIRSLPRLMSGPSPAEVQSSVSVADSVVRSLIMDAAFVNSKSMKRFLGLIRSAIDSSVESPRWCDWLPLALKRHVATAISSRTTQVMVVPPEQYVKQWFATASSVNQQEAKMSDHTTSRQHFQHRTPPSIAAVYMIRFCQQPSALIGGVSVGVLAFTSLSWVWNRLATVTTTPSLSVTIRLDLLVLSWVSAAYLGNYLPKHFEKGEYGLPVSRNVPVLFVSEKQGPPEASSESGVIRGGSDGTTEDGILVTEDEMDEFASTGSEPLNEDEDSLKETGLYENDTGRLSSPLPKYPENDGFSCWSSPTDSIFHVRGLTYFENRIKLPSNPAPLICRGVDIFRTDSPMRHISRHPAVLGGRLNEKDTFMVNFLLPFGNFVAYFAIPPLSEFPLKLGDVWSKFVKGDQEYRDARLKLLPVVVDGPWIVKTAVGPGNSPALLGKVIPLQYFFRDACDNSKAVYEVDVIITASTIAKGILSVVKGSAASVSIAFAFIIEAAEQKELPETVLCSFQIHSIRLEDCPVLPPMEEDSASENDVYG